DGSFFAAPQRRHKQIFWSVSCETMDYDIRGKVFQTINEDVQIFFHGIDGKSAFQIVQCQISPFQYMKELKLYPLDIPVVQIFHSLQYILAAFTGKSQNSMDNDFQIPLPKSLHSLFKTGERISSADICCSPFMNGLKPQLYPHGFYLIQLFQKSQYIWSQTVRAGANRNSRYLRMIYGLCIDFSQIFH